MPLPLHLSIHFFLALLSGYLGGSLFHQLYWGILAGILGGFLIDLDHVLEYFLVFHSFDLPGFLKSRQLEESGRYRLFFHAWEHVPVLAGLGWLVGPYSPAGAFLIVLAGSAFVHLVSDCFINRMPVRFYSLIYRAAHNFEKRRMFPEGFPKA